MASLDEPSDNGEPVDPLAWRAVMLVVLVPVPVPGPYILIVMSRRSHPPGAVTL